MLEIRKSSERGRSRYDWLDSRHSFSFGSYYDASNLGFRALRVINEDWIAPGAGFGPHPHRDMEILTYVIDGELSHRDGEGNASTLTHGRVQLMSAGRGIVHSEVNPSSDHPLHLLQIWIEPDERGLAPSYQEASIDLAPAELRPIATPRGEKGGLAIHQSASVYALALEPGQSFEYTLNDGRYAWVQAASGSGSLEEMALETGDVAVLRDEGGFSLSTNAGVEVLVFDLS
jgi:redox-sensitive bicupin YhaK (pirin superfamily)